jgi:uncharacterized protein (DUF433 family)
MASEASTTHTEYAHIVRTTDLLGGEARIDGQRIRVRDVVAARDRGGITPEEIASSAYPSLTLAQVYAALAYYEDHREEIDRAFEDEARLAEQFRREHPELVRDHASQKS